MKMAGNFQNSRKLWEREKWLVASNFSFSHSVFKWLVQQTWKNQGLFGKGISDFLAGRKNWKGKKCWLQAFSPFSTMFSSSSFSRGLSLLTAQRHLKLMFCMQISFMRFCSQCRFRSVCTKQAVWSLSAVEIFLTPKNFELQYVRFLMSTYCVG